MENLNNLKKDDLIKKIQELQSNIVVLQNTVDELNKSSKEAQDKMLESLANEQSLRIELNNKNDGIEKIKEDVRNETVKSCEQYFKDAATQMNEVASENAHLSQGMLIYDRLVQHMTQKADSEHARVQDLVNMVRNIYIKEDGGNNDE